MKLTHLINKSIISFSHFTVLALQMLREFNHVNPLDGEEGKVFLNARVSGFVFFFVFWLYKIELYHLLSMIFV